MSEVINGIAASNGIAIAKAFKLENPSLDVQKKKIDDSTHELNRFENAIKKSKEELEKIKSKALEDFGKDKAEIFSAHLLVLEDPELIDQVKATVEEQKVNAEYALHEVTSQFVAIFEGMEDEYMKERAADINDVSRRVLSHLLGTPISNPSMIAEEVIIVAEDLTPSDTAQLNRQFVKGFVTNIGGRTSHSAIMARSMEIPSVVGTKTITEKASANSIIIIDGLEGKAIIDPSSEEISTYEQKRKEFAEKQAEWAKLVNEKTKTKDDIHVELAANIGTPNDIEGVLNNGAEGIGLYRTEFLYMDRDDFPTEEEQFESYKVVLEKMEGKPVVIRTLDIGGDKNLSYLNLPEELNPFLGFRAIRLCLEEDGIFRTQLRALLRASIYGNLKIMFPMIATLDELRKAKQMLSEERDKLKADGIDVSETIEVGMMVEIPATAVLADQFAKEVDFFSIGTNDLIQYTLAADRMNERVSYLYQPYHPAVLRLINMVIQAAKKEGKWAGMCGEMAGEPHAIPILLGLGLDEFSMSASSILQARSRIRHLNKSDVEKIAEKALNLDTADEVVSFIEKHFTEL